MTDPSFDAKPPAAAPAPAAEPVPAPPAGVAGPSGGLSYGLGFLAFIGIPFLSVLTAGIVMASVYPSARKRGGLAAENARIAANWGFTLILGTVVTLGSHVLALVAVTDTPMAKGFYPVGIPITVFAALVVAHLVVIICGLVKASNREVFRNPLAIPFLRGGHRHSTPLG
jgi:uncharacterized Tic20 family protein